MNPGEAFLLAIEDGTIDVAQRFADRGDMQTRVTGIFLIVADVGNFGIRIGAPRDDQIRHFAARQEKRVGDDDSRHRVGGVGEFVAGANVAGGIDPGIGGPQPIIDNYPVGSIFHPRFRQT